MLWDEDVDDLKLVGGAGLVQSGKGLNTLTGVSSSNCGSPAACIISKIDLPYLKRKTFPSFSGWA